MNKYLTAAIGAAAALALSPAMAADGLGYTWGQLGYSQSTSGDSTTDAFGVDASVGFADLFHIQLGYVDGTIGEGDWDGSTWRDLDYDGYHVVLGVHPHVGANTDAIFNLRYTKIDLDRTRDDLSAFGIGAGLRHMLTDKLEVNGMINWDRWDVDHVSDDFTTVSWAVGGRYLITPEFSLGIGYDNGDNEYGVGTATIDFRYQFRDLF